MKKYLLIVFIHILCFTVWAIDYRVENTDTWAAFDFFNEDFEDFLKLDADIAFRVLNVWGNTKEEALRYSFDIKDVVKKLHENGKKSSGMLGGISVSAKENQNFLNSVGARNPLGRITGVDSNILHGCYNRKEWRDRLEFYYEIFVKTGIDIMELDQPAQEHWRTECYCDECNSDFTKYLLKNNLINNKDFSYVNFLKNRRIAHLNQGDIDRYSSYGKEYWKYQILKDTENIGKIVREFKRFDPLIRFTGNSWGLAGEYIPAVKFYDFVDVAGDLRTPWVWEPQNEFFGPPYNTWIPVVKVAQILNKGKILSFLDTYPYDRLLKEFHDEKDLILNIFASEMLASGAEFVFPYSNRVAYTNENNFDRENIRRFISFIKTNRDLFEKRDTDTQVLIKCSKDDLILNRFSKKYWAVAYFLLDNGLDYDFIFTESENAIDNNKYELIIDLNKYDNKIFDYVYQKEDKYMQDIKEKLKSISNKIKINRKYNRILKYNDLFGQKLVHIVNNNINKDKKEKYIIDIGDVKEVTELKFYPYPISHNQIKNENGVTIEFDKEPVYTVIRYK